MKRHWMLEWFRFQWSLVKINIQFSYCLYKISRLKQPIITLFGGTEVLHEKNEDLSKIVFDFAQKLKDYGCSIITGGGPGIMEAASCGVTANLEKKDKAKYALGISVYGIDVGYKNDCTTVIKVSDFYLRKLLMRQYSDAFIIFPGGLGTVDELFELLNLLKFGKVSPAPVVLVGKEYWKFMYDWYQLALKDNLIDPHCANLFRITDDLDEAFEIICSVCKI